MPVLAELAPEQARRLVRGNRYIELAHESGAARYVQFLHHGSEELVREVKAFRRAMRLFQGLLLALPVLSISFALLARHSPIHALVAPALVLSCIATLLIFVAQRVQYRNYFETAVAARNELGRSLQERRGQPDPPLQPTGGTGSGPATNRDAPRG